MPDYAKNAITAKIKALYGSRLSEEQYNILMNKKNVSEAAAYLKEETVYGALMNTVQPSSVHRGELENLLNKDRFIKYNSLRYYSNSQDSYYNYILAEIEIGQILYMIRLLNTGKTSDFIAQAPFFIEKGLNIDLISLANVDSFDALLEVLAKTGYALALSKCRPSENEKIDYTLCETALYSLFYKQIRQITAKSFNKKIQKQLETLFDTYIELTNINSILRLKRFYPDTSAARIESYILPTNGRLKKDFLYSLINSRDADEVLEKLHNSSFAKYFGENDEVFIEYDIYQIRYRLASRFLHFSTDAPVVFTAFMILKAIEVSNITMIIEGIRYNIGMQEISTLIVR